MVDEGSNTEERAEKRAALRRYEEARRDHLGNATNLLFAVAVAGIGFCSSLLTGKDGSKVGFPANYCFIVAIGLLIASAGFGMLIVWARANCA